MKVLSSYDARMLVRITIVVAVILSSIILIASGGRPFHYFSTTCLDYRQKDYSRRYNSNSSENSPHLYGNTFDISYKRFIVRKLFLTNCDHKYLKEALAEVIWQLRNEKRCWATYERMQNCFHVVAR
jgi:hypothetical protein